MSDVISRFSGSKSSDVILGSKAGVDVSVLRIDSHKIMIVSCDPVTFIPSLGPKLSAQMSVYEVASDVATSGIRPEFAVVDLNLPPHLSDDLLTQYWKSFHLACQKIGLSIVGGHTGRFEGCDYSVIGGATLWAFCGPGEYVTSVMAQDGDDLILTKSAGFGATAVLTRAFPRTTKKALGRSLFDRAWTYFSRSNTVIDAVSAASGGIHDRGVTAMHDATEGGVVTALLELANASRLGGIVYLDEIPIPEETLQLCRFYRIDPLISLGEGSLIIACRPPKTESVRRILGSKRIDTAVVGQLSSKIRGLQGVTSKGGVKMQYPSLDPYWQAYWRAVQKGWS